MALKIPRKKEKNIQVNANTEAYISLGKERETEKNRDEVNIGAISINAPIKKVENGKMEKMENNLLQHHTKKIVLTKFSKSNRSNRHTAANHIEITKVTNWHEIKGVIFYC